MAKTGIKAQSLQQYQKAYGKMWRKKNRKRVNAQKATYRAQNKKRIAAINLRYYKKTRLAILMYHQLNRM